MRESWDKYNHKKNVKKLSKKKAFSENANSNYFLY